MSERRTATKGRRLGSSRRKQLREGSGEAPAPVSGPIEEPPGASEIVERVQQLLSSRDTEQEGCVTRSDLQKLQEEGFPCSAEELELVFDGLDAAGTGRLGTEEFMAGLRQFLSSQKAAKEHRRRKTASRRVRLVLPSPALEGVDSEERRHFAAFMEQLGTDNISEEQEIWQLWVKLRQDEPQLLDNLEGFLAKMRHRIQDVRSEKEALELTLNKRVAEHDKDVQQLCEVLEQQIQQEQLRLQQQSAARSHQHSEELQRVLDASEREVQRLVSAQMELERRCRSLHSSQQVTSTENQQLQESNQALEDHLQHLHQQLQQTQGHLRTMRATVAWEQLGEPGDRVVAELPIEVPMSPQLSPGKSEKFRSEMRIRLGSQSGESKAKSTHQAVWEMLPAEINLSPAPRKMSSAEEDPFQESLKEERFSDQSSLLREMNDAIAALSKHLKAQAPGAPPALADTPFHPWGDAEPQTGPEAATAHGTTPEVLQETLPGHVHRELLEGDLQEEPATAELRAPDVTQAGASTGTRHRMAQEPGAVQGESPEEAQRMLFLQGKGAGVEEMVLNVAEHLGESTESGEQVLMEVEGAGWMQEKSGWEKPQLLGEAEEVEINQGENLEAGLGPPETRQEGVAVGQCPAMEELQPAGIPGECVQAPATALPEWAEPSSGLPEKLETELGEHLPPEPPSWGEAQVEAVHGDGVPEVTVAPGPGLLQEERATAEVQPQGEPEDSKVLEVLPAPAERAGSSRARGEEEEVEEAEPREAEQQLQGECARGGAGWAGSTGAQEPLAAAVPPTHGQEGGAGADVELLEAQSSDTNMELLAEVEADLQVSSEAESPGTQQGGGVDPGVPQEKEDKAELGLGEEMGAAAVHSEGPAPAETPVRSPDLCGLFPVKSQELDLVEADPQQCGDLSPETPQGGKGGRDVQLQEDEEEDGAQEQGEYGRPLEPVPHPNGVTLGQGEGAGAGLQPQEEAESLDTAEDQSSGGNVQLIAEEEELRLTPGGSTEADLQPLGEAGSPGTEQGGRLDPDVQPLDQADKEKFLEMEAEDAQEDTMVCECLSPRSPWGGEGERDVQIEEEEDGAQGQDECELSHDAARGAGVGQGERADGGRRAQEEAASQDITKDQSTDTSVQLIAEVDELQLTPRAPSTEADLRPPSQTDSQGTEQGGSVAPDVHPRDKVDKAESVEMEAENAQEDVMFHEGLSPGGPWGGQCGKAVHLREEEEEDGGQGQGECELPPEPVLDLQGAGVSQGGGAGAGLQPGKEAESLDTVEEQSSGASVQLIAEGTELKSASGESTEADLQPLSQTDSLGTEQGGSVAPDVHPLDQVDKKESVEMEAEDAQEDTTFHEGLSPGVPWRGDSGTDTHLEGEEEEKKENGARGQGECELSHEPVLDLQGAGLRQGEGAEGDMQAQEEAESLDTAEEQCTDTSVQLIAEGDELKSVSGESTEAHLQPLGEAGSPGTEQRGRLDPDVHPDQVDKKEFLEMEVEDAPEDAMFHEGLSPGAPWRGDSGTGVHLREEKDKKEGGALGQGGCELPQEPVLDLQGAGVGQTEGAGAGVLLWEEAERPDTAEEQSTDTSVQLIAEGTELKSASGESTEADLQPLSQTDSLGTEQGGSVAPDVHPLDQVDKKESVEMETEDSWRDTQLCGGASPETPQGEGGRAAVQPRDGAGDWGQGQGEHGLGQELVPHPSGVSIRQRRETDAGVRLWEEVAILDTAEDQSSGGNVQLTAERGELRLTPGGSTEADLQLVGEAGSPGTEHRGGLDPDVQLLDQGNKAELVEAEAEDAQEDVMFHEGLSPGAPWRGEIGTDIHLEGEEEEKKENGARGQGECELSHEPVLDLQGAGLRQGEGAEGDMQAQEEAESLDTIEEQSTDTSVQLIAEGDELKSVSGESTEADLQPLGEAGSPGTEQRGRLDPDVHPDQVDKKEFLEMEVEDAQEDVMFHEGLSPGAPWRGDSGTGVHLREEKDKKEGGALGQGRCELPQEPVLDLQGAGVGQTEGAGAGVLLWEEAESLDTAEEQSTDTSVQLIAEGTELKSASGESTEADLQPLSQTDSLGTEQGGSVAPDVHPLDQVDKKESVEMETEDSWRDTQLCGGASPETPQGEGGRAAVQPRDGAGDWGQGQGEHGLGQELVPHPSGVSIRQRRETDASVRLWEEVAILDTAEDQSSGGNVQLTAERGELRLTPGGSTEADLQLVGEAGSPGTEHRGGLDPDVQLLDQGNKAELVEAEAEDAQEDVMFHEGLSPGAPWGGDSGTGVHLREEKDKKEGGALGQGGCELPQEPVLDLQGAGVGQTEGAGAGVLLWEEAESLDTAEEQSTDTSVQLIAEGTELKPASGESLGSQWVGEGGTAVQSEEDGAQGEHGLPQDSVPDPQGAGGRQGEGAGTGPQPQEEAERLDTLAAQSTDADVQLEQQEPKSGPGGSRGADLTPLGVAGVREGEQSLSPGLEAGLGAAPTVDPWEGAALCPEPVPAAEGPGLEAKLGACIAPEGQILEDTQALELLQGERAPAEGKPLDGAHGLEAAQGERLEAGARNAVKTQGLGLNQGHGHTVPALASPVSAVPSQSSTLKLEMLMQEDVLIPDVWRLCAPGQAAQRELQEQVSAQGHEGRLPMAALQPEGETRHAMELEHEAAEPAGPPKQEVPSASTLHTTVRPEGAGSEQLGMGLRESSLGQAQLLGEQSKDVSVGQREKMQEFGQKMSQEGEPSPAEPGAVTAGGAGGAPRGCPKASQDPDHLYNVLFVGDSHVGKTSFLYRLHADTFNPHLSATVGLDYQIKNLVVDNKRFALRLWDSAGQERYHSMTKQFFRKADGVVLMYDITSEYSFSDVRYWLSCIQEAAEDGVAVLLLGNKTDCAAQRQVPTKEGECLAKEHQLMFYECSAASGHNVFESMVSFIRLLKVREDELKNKAEEVPKAPQKKKGCCW